MSRCRAILSFRLPYTLFLFCMTFKISGCLISLAKPHLPTTNAISFNTRFWQQTIAAPF
jgi:hypothetical protein